jgi:hypothetical protein
VLIRWRTMRSLTRTVRQIKLPLMRLDHQHPGARPMTFPALRIHKRILSPTASIATVTLSAIFKAPDSTDRGRVVP